jgi:hypothetical protein
VVEIAFEQPSGTGPTRASQTAERQGDPFFFGRVEDRFSGRGFDPFGRAITKA